MEFMYEHNGNVFTVEILKDKDDYIIQLGERRYSLMDVLERSEGMLKFQLDHRSYKCRVAASDELRHIFIDGKVYQLKRVTPKDARTAAKEKARSGEDAAASSGKIQSPINGKIIRIWVDENTAVTAEQDLVIIEAMKMEHRIKSPFAGTVQKIHIQEGTQVELGTLLMDLVKPGSDQKEAD